jgi:hypothetical protein
MRQVARQIKHAPVRVVHGMTGGIGARPALSYFHVCEGLTNVRAYRTQMCCVMEDPGGISRAAAWPLGA